MKPAAGYRPLAYSSPEAVQTTGTVADYRVTSRLEPQAEYLGISVIVDIILLAKRHFDARMAMRTYEEHLD